MEEATIQARSMDTIWHDSFRVYGGVFFPVLPVCFLFAFPLVLLSGLNEYVVQFAKQPASLLFLKGLLTVIVLLVSTYFYGLLLSRIFGLLMMRKKTLGDAVRDVLGKSLRLFPVMLVTTVLTFLGFMFVLFPGIFLMVLFAFAVPAVVLENETIFGSIRMSIRLVWGNWWRTAVVLFLPIAIIALLLSIAVLFLGPHIGSIGVFFLRTFLLASTVPFIVTLIIMQMSDLEVRRAIRAAQEAEELKSEPVNS